jgi:hypothetical protein
MKIAELYRDLGLPTSITQFVRGHVQAKRYLGMKTCKILKTKMYEYTFTGVYTNPAQHLGAFIIRILYLVLTLRGNSIYNISRKKILRGFNPYSSAPEPEQWTKTYHLAAV